MSTPGAAGTVRARVADVVDRARSQTGLEDFGGDSWREGLEVLVGAAETEATFNDLGRESFYASVVRPLVNRLRIEDWYRRYPEIDEQEVEVELLGVGFPRTGSTALVHMLGEDTRFRSLRMWEEMSPCPPPGMSDEDDRARLEAARATVARGRDHMAERLRSMLPQSESGPTEDHDLMALEFKAQIFLVGARVPSYAEWFAHCDMEPTYLYERRALKLLQWRTPQKRWRLKSPTHTMFLDAYEKVFPTTCFVQTHRDVSRVLPSVCDLYYTMLQPGNPGIDPAYVGEVNREQWGIALDRCLAYRARPGRDARFFDIGFTRFQSDPIDQVERLYQWLGDDLDGDVVARMRAWRADNPKDKYGRHEYHGEEFGITGEVLSGRFGDYRRRFAAYLD